MTRQRGPGGPRGPRGGPPHMAGMLPGEKAKNFRASLKRLMTYLRPVLPHMLFVLCLAALSVLFNVLGPGIMGRATDVLMQGFLDMQSAISQGLEPKGTIDFAALGDCLLLLGILYALSALFQFFQGFVMSGATRRIVVDMRRQIDRKLDRLPLSYYDKTPRGEILARVTGDVDNIASTLQQNIMQIISSGLTLGGVLVVMFAKNLSLTLICLLTVPLVMLFSMLVMRRSHKYFSAQWKDNGVLTGQVEENFTGHMVVRAFNREQDAIDTFRETNARLCNSSFRAQFLSGIIMPFMMMMNNLNFVAVCLIGGLRVISGTMTVGDVQAMIQYSRYFTQPIQQIASIMNVLQSTVASAERVFELLDSPEESPEPAEAPGEAPRVRGEVRFQDLSFAYDADRPLIRGMELHVPPGCRVAIVGPTGAGKTTLVNLLMRFYEPDSGRITIDGTDIAAMSRRRLRSLCGMVLQDTWLFGGTIRDNIAYGREGATEEEIRAAAVDAHADHFIRTLEEGYDTVLNDDATNISQGQRQLLTIARAFLSRPAILILDEATSSVDTRTELLIRRAMEKLMAGRTCFIIAHRLSTIRDADVILVMRDGGIVEQGSHTELLRAKGFYYELYNSQYEEASAL